ncbi:MAG: hypothetical protein QM655_11270 [Nocardioidaceae bacterium]
MLTAATLLTVALLGLLSTQTVANPRAEPWLPPIRVSILLACVASNLVVAWLRPVMQFYEVVSTRGSLVLRAPASIVATALTLGMSALATAGRDRAATYIFAALLGLGLVGACLHLLTGILLPWLYAISGLAFGYQTRVGTGGASLQPWAWIIDETTSSLHLAIGVLGGLIFALFGPPRIRTLTWVKR